MPSGTFIIETFPPNTDSDLGIWFLTLLMTLKAEEVTCYEESHFLYEDTSTKPDIIPAVYATSV